MSTIAVANTTANISGKTIALIERDHTITGTWTFSRSPSAPFAVAAGSAKVSNLDADKLDGLDSTAFVLLSTKGWLSVLDYGAVGNNSTDDGPAFQAAHDALPSSGGVILVPQAPTSKYSINTRIVCTKPVIWQGAGWATIIRAATASTLTAVIEFNAGSQGSVVRDIRFEGSRASSGSTPIQRCIYINGAKDCTVTRCNISGPSVGTGFNFGVDINGVTSGRSTVSFNRFERMVSSAGSGSAVLIELSNYNLIAYNDIDGTDFTTYDASAGACIFLSASSSGGVGSTENRIVGNRINNHPQVGIDVNSTTYCEFPGNLGACDSNIIEDNDIYSCGISPAAAGDAGSGIAIVSNSNFNIIRNNKIHGNGVNLGGFGIVLIGALGTAKTITAASATTPITITSNAHGFSNGNTVGVSGVLGNTGANGSFTISGVAANTFVLDSSVYLGSPYTSGGLVGIIGTPKIDQAPNYNEITNNRIYSNYDDGIRIKGANNTTIQGNRCYENGVRTANTFRNIYLTTVGGAAVCNGTVIIGNSCVGSTPKYQIEIGASVTGTYINGNYLPAATTGVILDGASISQTIIGQNSPMSTCSASAYNSAVQSVTNSSWVILTMDSEDNDSDAIHSTSANTSRMTIPAGRSGRWLIRGKTRIVAGAAGTLRGVAIYKNGSVLKYNAKPVNNPTSADFDVVVEDVAAAGDYYELAGFQDTAGALNMGDATRPLASEIQVVWLGP